MTNVRAKQIIYDARAQAGIGPWSDQLSNVMTEDERDDVVAVWKTMSGSTCFVDALLKISNGAIS